METKTICGESLEQNQAHLIPDLRFKDIAPKWAARLGPEEEFPIFLSSTWFKWFRELKYTSKCVVGEDCENCEERNIFYWHKEHKEERFVPSVGQ